jgi:hypothetical protein
MYYQNKTINLATRNTIAAKSARRKAKDAKKAAAALVSNYSPIKNYNMGQTNRIGVMVKVKTKSGVDNFIAFETDNEEFLPIYYSVMSSGKLGILQAIRGLEIIEHFEKQKAPSFEFSMLVLQFISTTTYHQCIANNGGQSFGVVVDLDETKNKAAVDLMEFDKWKNLLDKESGKGSSKFYC